MSDHKEDDLEAEGAVGMLAEGAGAAEAEEAKHEGGAADADVQERIREIEDDSA